MPQLKQNNQRQSQKTTTKRTVQRQLPKKTASAPQSILQRAQTNPQSLDQEDVLQLQRTIGNQATLNVINSQPTNGNMIQRKNFWGKVGRGLKKTFSFDNMFGVDAVRQKRNRQLDKAKGLGSKVKLEREALPVDYYRQRIKEQREVREFVIEYGRSAQGIKRAGNHKDQKPTMEVLLAHPMARAIFKNYCEKEYATENYIFFDMVVDTTKDLAKLRHNHWIKELTMGEAIWLYDNMIERYHPYTVNLSVQTRDKVAEAVGKMKQQLGETGQTESLFGSAVALTTKVPSNVQSTFVTAFGEVHHRLSDTFTSFRSNDAVYYAMVAMNPGLGGEYLTKRALFDPIIGHSPTRNRR